MSRFEGQQGHHDDRTNLSGAETMTRNILGNLNLFFGETFCSIVKCFAELLNTQPEFFSFLNFCKSRIQLIQAMRDQLFQGSSRNRITV